MSLPCIASHSVEGNAAMPPPISEALLPEKILGIISDMLMAVEDQSPREQLVTTVMHDMRTPLQIIALCTDMLSLTSGMSSSAMLAISRLRSAADRICGLIDELILAPPTRGPALLLHPVRISVDTLLGDVIAMMQAIADRNNIVLRLVSSADACSIELDYQRMLRVFSNLIGNAIKFSPPGSEIRLRADPVESGIRFSVNDQGPGIPAADIPKLYDRGWQAIPGDQRGAGLGLAIVKEIVERHGGSVGVLSVPGRGSEFHFTIPLPLAKTPHHQLSQRSFAGSPTAI